MRKISLFLATTVFYVVVASRVHSQNAPPQQPGTATQPAAGAAAPAAAPGTIPAPPATANPAIDQKQVSYALGRQFAMNMKNNEIPCDVQSLFAGINDVMTGAQPKYTEEQLGATMQRFMQEMQQKNMARAQQQLAKNKKMEADFLAKNKVKPGVQTTASGLQYKVIKAGNGPSPTLSDTVRCNYRGVLLDGTEFDSSECARWPATIPS